MAHKYSLAEPELRFEVGDLYSVFCLSKKLVLDGIPMVFMKGSYGLGQQQYQTSRRRV